MIVSLHCSIGESVILRASPISLTRPLCLVRDLLVHAVASRFEYLIFFFKLIIITMIIKHWIYI